MAVEYERKTPYKIHKMVPRNLSTGGAPADVCHKDLQAVVDTGRGCVVRGVLSV